MRADTATDPDRVEPGFAAHGIPSLDGIRAIAVAVVCLDHAIIHGLVPAWLHHARALSLVGTLGVRTFFVLSGYLITTLLVREREQAGRVGFAAFYARRTLRIFPPYYAYLAVVAALAATGALTDGALAPVVAQRWWPAWAYLVDLVPTNDWYTMHAWTLSVEEQFYLLWPPLFVFGWTRGGRRGAAWAAAGLFLLAPVGRVASFALAGYTSRLGPWQTDFLAAGCLAALLPDVSAWMARRTTLVALVVAAAVALNPLFGDTIRWMFAANLMLFQPAQALALAAGVVWCVAHPRGLVGRALDARAMRAVGLASYSVYLWQELWFGPWLTARIGHGLARWAALAIALLGTAACAAASYWLVERPSLRLRARLERRRRTRVTTG